METAEWIEVLGLIVKLTSNNHALWDINLLQQNIELRICCETDTKPFIKGFISYSIMATTRYNEKLRCMVKLILQV